MTEREKLIDLAHDYFKSVPWYADIADLNPEELIDHILANGVRLESEQATSDENKRWIPVTERLPEINEDDTVNCVLVTNGRVIHMAYFVNENWFFCENGQIERPMFYDVTHWMPLPKPPKEDV